MNYAIIENGIVVNIIVGLPDGVDGIPLDGLPVIIGDVYENGVFLHDGNFVLALTARVAELETAVAERDEALAKVEEALNG